MNQAGPYFGRVKSYNSKKGYGFIECPAARAVYGRDVFIHKAQMGELLGRFVGPGTRLDPKCLHMHVRFSVGSNREGMPQARDVIRIQMPDETGDMMTLGLPPVLADAEVPLFQPLGNFGGLPLGGYVPQTGGASSSREEPRSYRGRGGTIRLMHGQEAGGAMLDGGCAGQRVMDPRFKDKKRGKGAQDQARYGAGMRGPGGDDHRRRRPQQDQQPQFIGNPMYPQLYGSAPVVQPPFGACPGGGQADSPTSAAYGLGPFIAGSPDQQVPGGSFGQDGCQGAMHMLSQYAAATMTPPPPYPAYLPQAQFQQDGADTPQSQTGSPASRTALHLADQVQSPQQPVLNPLQDLQQQPAVAAQLQAQQPLQIPLPGQHPQYLLPYQQALMNPAQMASLLGDESMVRGAPGAACQGNPLAPALNPALMAPMMYAQQIGLPDGGTPTSRQSFGFGFTGEDNPRTAPSTPDAVSPGGRSGGSDDDDVGLRAQPLSPLYLNGLGPTSLPNFMGLQGVPAGWPRMEGGGLEQQVQERLSHSL
mmetsp:Transcript_59357/g.109759  ORF Transcript_59357/g.109759 Transcript_59357/m.109759 type:complete len:533 (+) Transcript_59357:105-1703(+)